MKLQTHLLPCIVSAILFVGCAAFQDEEPLTNQTVSFTAETSEPEIQSRTSSQADGKVKWLPGDAISVFTGSASSGGSRFTSTATKEESTTTFTGYIATSRWNTTYTAIYPCSESNRSDGSNLYTTLRATQTSKAGSFGNGQWPTVARSNSKTLTFRSICSGIRFSVATAGIKSVTFRNLDGGIINGELKIGFDWNSNPNTPTLSNGTDAITVTPEGSETFTVGQDYYVVLPVITMTKGIAVTYTTATASATYTNNTSLSFTKGRFKRLNGKDSGLNPGGDDDDDDDDDDGDIPTFCLENATIKAYFDEAEKRYTDDNYSTVSIARDYYTGRSASNRLDIPAPVRLSWASASGSGQYQVNIYNNEARTDLELTQSTSSTSADIFNLIPNRKYWYTVTRNSATAASGAFVTEGRRRMLKVSDSYDRGHANNCRDLGGMKTLDGKSLRYNLIFRGSNLNSVTSAEKEYLTGYMNIRMDVDLRTNSSGQYGCTRVFGNETGVGYSNAKFNNWNDLQNAGKIKTTFTDIINTIKAGNACYIHCYSGADRTGYICLLIEAVCGVSPRDCTIDYELTSFSIVGLRGRDGSKDSSDTTYITEGMQYINSYKKGTTFKEKAENILLDAGITSQQISDLRKALIEN